MGLYVDIKKDLPGFTLQIKFSCKEGIIGILGASGSGKSMLLNCIAGLIRPDDGKIIVNDKTFFDAGKRINLAPRDRKAGFLFQNYALFPHLTIAENIAFGLDGLSKSDKSHKVNELLERFHLADMGNRYPAQISGGQQQRTALARALAVEPDILLLDEPFSALDNHLKMHMMKDMQTSLKDFHGITLFVTHNIEEAYRLCDHIAILNTGRLDALDWKQELFNNPQSLETAKITGCKNLAAAIRKSEHCLEVPDWGIEIKSHMRIDHENGFAGIRANHIKLADDCTRENCFPAWIIDESEMPFRSTLYLKIGTEPNPSDSYNIQWEMSTEQREAVKRFAQPIYIYLDPMGVFFVKD